MLRRLWLSWCAALSVWRAGWTRVPPGAAMEIRMVRPVDPRDAEIARLRAEVLHLRRQAEQRPAALPPAPALRSLPPLREEPRRGQRPPDTRPLLDRAVQPAVNVEAIVGGLKKLGYGPKTAQAAAAKAMAKGGDAGEIMRRALQCAQEG